MWAVQQGETTLLEIFDRDDIAVTSLNLFLVKSLFMHSEI